MTHPKIKRAIISVYDKTGLEDLARGLLEVLKEPEVTPTPEQPAAKVPARTPEKRTGRSSASRSIVPRQRWAT